MMDNETRTLLLDLQGWFESPERAGPGLTRAGFLRRIKKVLERQDESGGGVLFASDIPALGARASAAGAPRRAPEEFTPLLKSLWNKGYDAASEAAIEAEVIK